jgi:putative ABC transport system permease protein
VNSPRQAKIFRDLWLYKARTALVVLAMAVGVAAFGMMFTARTVLQRDLASEFAGSHPAHAVLTVSDFDEELVEIVAGLPGVQAAEARRVVQAKVEIALGQWNRLEVQGIPSFNDMRISRLKIPGDVAITPAEGTVLLDRSVVGLMPAGAGTILKVRTFAGKNITLQVAGLVNDIGPLPGSISAMLNGYASMSTLEQLGEPQAYNRLFLVFENAGDRPAIEQATTLAVKTVEAQGYMVYSAAVPEPGKPVLYDNMSTALLIMGSLGVLILLASAFLITNIMSTIIAQQIPQIGILKSLGARSVQITTLYMEVVLILGGLALLLAVPLGMIGGYFLGQGLAESMDFDMLSFGLPLETFLFQIAAAVIVPVLAALVPVLNGARLTIRQALSSVGLGDDFDSGSLSGRLTRVAGLPRLLVLSIRNTFRQTGRLVLTLAALSLAGAMFISVIGIRRALQAAVARLQQVQHYDVQLNFDRPYPVAPIEQVAKETPGMQAYETWSLGDARRVFSTDWLGGSMLLIGLPDDTQMARPQVLDGRWIEPGDRQVIFLNADAVRDNPGLRVGEEVVLNVGGHEETFEFIGSGARSFQPIAYISYADFEQATGLKGYASQLVIHTKEETPAFQSEVEADLLNRFEKTDITVSFSNTLADANRRESEQLDTLVVLLLVVSILIAVVGGIGLASMAGMNVLERTREIGVLRSLGAQGRVIQTTVILEGLTVSLLSTVLAALISVPLSILLGNALGQTLLLVPLDYRFPTRGLAAWLLLVTVITVLACWAPARSAARLTIRDALTYNG